MTFKEQHALETLKSMVTISVEAFKTLVLLNGGAMVACLAYLAKPERAGLASLAVAPLLLFAVGLVLGVLSFAGSYRTQLALYSEDIFAETFTGTKHTQFLWWTFGIALASLGAFLAGVIAGVVQLARL